MNQIQQTIYIFGSIGTNVTSDQVRSQLAMLDRSAPLMVEINSDGGSVQEGVAIFNQLKNWPGGVTTLVQGWACSIASVIVMAGDVRMAHESAMLMIHAPWTTEGGNADALRGTADLLDQIASTMLVAYRVSGQTHTVISSWLDGKNHWFTASEANLLGLVTELVGATTQASAPANIQASRHSVPTHLKELFMNQTSTPVNQPVNVAAIQAAAVRADSDRRLDIRSKFAKFASREGVSALQASCENNPAISAQVAADKLLAHLGGQCTPINSLWAIPINFDGGDNRMQDFKAAATDVLAARSGLPLKEPHPAARDLQRMGIVGMAEAILSMQGLMPTDRSPSSVIHAAMTTSDFPSLLSGTANKFLRDGYEFSSNGFVQFTAEREVPDFKPNTLVNLSEAPGLQTVPERGEYRHGYMTDSASTFQLETSGKIISLTRQMLVNDDLSAFTTIPRAFGASARRLEADKVYAKLTANAALGDGVALFHATHNNLGTAAAISVNSLGLARAAMRKHKGIGGLGYLDVQPRYLIVPVALETTAEQLLASLVDPSKSNDTGNAAFIRGLTLIADPRLDDDSAVSWYLAADPKQVEGILRAYLQGEQRPHLEEEISFKTDAISYKVRLDFAAGVVDYRALYKNPGA